MYVLGIKYGGHDAAAALVKDGEIIAACEEERFVRIKHAPGLFPIHAIKFCLQRAGISISDVDYMAYPWHGRKKWLREVGIRSLAAFRANLYNFGTMRALVRVGKGLVGGIENEERLKYALGVYFGSNLPKIVYISHHLAHAASAYYVSPFRHAKILTLDGLGDVASTFFAHGVDKSIKVLKTINYPHSLGYFYGQFTELLGFRQLNGEGKTMGLAPYGKPKFTQLMNEVIREIPSGFTYDYRYGVQYTPPTRTMIEKFGPKNTGSNFTEHHMDLAASVQKKLEETALHLLEILSNQCDERALCLAGGVALNCKMNGRLLRSDYVDDIFVQPAANDAGCALGAALELSERLGRSCRTSLNHVYLGPEYPNEKIEEDLRACKVPYSESGDIAGEAAELVARGKIVGWFQGRLEFGPRALGNRSILADPTNPKMKDIINHQVKHREPFRPYCPSILDRAAEEYFINPYPSPFMILTFQVKEEKWKEIPAVVHVDGSTRPQTLDKETNPLYYKMISEFESEKGVPVVLNTSFNVRGEPIVCSPLDALRCFYSTGMDALAIGNFLIQKSH